MPTTLTPETVYGLVSSWREYIEREGPITPAEYILRFRPGVAETLAMADSEDYQQFCVEWDRQVRYLSSVVNPHQRPRFKE